MGEYGYFRVRQRSDGKIAVRIFNRDDRKISFPIMAVDKIEPPEPHSDPFSCPFVVDFQ